LLRIACLDPRLHQAVQLLPGLDSKQRRLQAIKSLEMRCLVLSVVHRLLAQSGRCLSVKVTDPLCSVATLRVGGSGC
jgi:hypothetical protein